MEARGASGEAFDIATQDEDSNPNAEDPNPNTEDAPGPVGGDPGSPPKPKPKPKPKGEASVWVGNAEWGEWDPPPAGVHLTSMGLTLTLTLTLTLALIGGVLLTSMGPTEEAYQGHQIESPDWQHAPAGEYAAKLEDLLTSSLSGLGSGPGSGLQRELPPSPTAMAPVSPPHRGGRGG